MRRNVVMIAVDGNGFPVVDQPKQVAQPRNTRLLDFVRREEVGVRLGMAWDRKGKPGEKKEESEKGAAGGGGKGRKGGREIAPSVLMGSVLARRGAS